MRKSSALNDKDLTLPLLERANDLDLSLTDEHNSTRSSPPHTPGSSHDRSEFQDTKTATVAEASAAAANKKLLMGTICLIIGAVSSGSVIPMMAYLKATGVSLKFSWRFFASTVVFLPLALNTKNRSTGKNWTLRELFFSDFVLTGSISAILWLIWMGTALYASLQYSFLMADLFSNTTSVFILIYHFIMKVPIKRGEVIGVIIALSGAAFTFIGPREENRTLSDLAFSLVIAMIGALAGATYFLITEKKIAQIPTDVFLCVTSFFGWIFSSIAAIAFDGASVSFDPEFGIFGLLVSSNFYVFPILAIVCGYSVVKLTLKAVEYMGSLTVSLFLLLAPAIAGLESWAMGLNSFPNWSSLVSAGIMTIGLIVLILTKQESSSPPSSTEQEVGECQEESRHKLVDNGCQIFQFECG